MLRGGQRLEFLPHAPSALVSIPLLPRRRFLDCSQVLSRATFLQIGVSDDTNTLSILLKGDCLYYF